MGSHGRSIFFSISFSFFIFHSLRRAFLRSMKKEKEKKKKRALKVLSEMEGTDATPEEVAEFREIFFQSC